MDVTLLLGATGVEKRSVVDRLMGYRKEIEAEPTELPFLDLERDFIAETESYEGEMFRYLDDSEASQRSAWRTGWDKLLEELQEREAEGHERVLVGLHGTLVRDLYGVRSPIDISLLSSIRPARIITLIDDVYSMWARTEARAKEGAYIGQPTLGQLMDARRTELLLGDLIAAHVSAVAPRNWIIAAKSPARQLHRILEFEARELRSVYVSFPISGPRRSVANGNPTAPDEVDSFLIQVTRREGDMERAVAFNPLTIDELPLIDARSPVKDGSVRFQFDPSMRWDLGKFWPEESLLSIDRAESIEVVSEQVDEAAGAIHSDIRVRDYRLVRQSKSLLAFNPLWEGKQASGVNNEIEYAWFHQKPVHVYQDPDHDPKREVDALLRGREGTLGAPLSAPFVTIYANPEEALAAALPDDTEGGDADV